MSQRESDAFERIKSDLPGAIGRAIDIVCELTKERRATRLSVPVDFNRDEDFILINTYQAARDTIAQLTERNAGLEKKLNLYMSRLDAACAQMPRLRELEQGAKDHMIAELEATDDAPQ